ncbi:MAG TPA: hypothetical protein VFB06_34460 [Streptosporangiaceae bacterium]|nr:hypothetical protein [Streptosporangiaceae bacterium]
MTGPHRRMAYRDLPPDDMAPVIGWDDFLTDVFRWRQNQHIGLIGPTESGKSTLTYALVPMRRYVTFFATKPRDETLDQFAKRGGFQRIEDWPPRRNRGLRLRNREYTADEMPRRLLWPDATRLGSVGRQQEVFGRAFEDIYTSGGWCTIWDEFWMMCRILKMEDQARIMLQQARSNDIAFVMGAQRPSRIPLELFDQSTHLFFWRDNDEANLKRIGGVGWLASNPIRAFVANLDPYQVLYIHTRKGHMYRTTAPEL